MQVIGYTYEADYHCIECATKAFGYKLTHPERVGKAIDSEGNEVHPVFDTDEWYANAIYEGETHDTLNCGDCFALMYEWHSAEFSENT
jgi:hypothetical protein